MIGKSGSDHRTRVPRVTARVILSLSDRRPVHLLFIVPFAAAAGHRTISYAVISDHHVHYLILEQRDGGIHRLVVGWYTTCCRSHIDVPGLSFSYISFS